MKKILFIFIIISITGCFVKGVKYDYNLAYFNNNNLYVLELYNIPLDCKEVILKKNEVITRNRASEKKVHIIIPDQYLSIGKNYFNLIFCDKQIEVNLNKSFYEIINVLIYGKSLETIKCRDYEEIINLQDFINEITALIREDDANFVKLMPIIDCLPIEDKLKIINFIITKNNVSQVLPYIFDNVDQFYSTPTFENTITLLLKSENIFYQKKAVELIFNYPVKRFYESFFKYIYITTELHQELLNFIKNKSYTEFSDEVFKFAQKRIIDGDNSLIINEIFNIYSTSGKDRFSFLMYLIKNPTQNNSKFIIKLIKEIDFDYEKAYLLLNNIGNIFDSETLFVVYNKLHTILKNEPEFYKKMIKLNNEKINVILMENINELDFKYKHNEFIEFFKNSMQKDRVNQIVNYFLDAPDNIGKEAFTTFHINNPDLKEILIILKEKNPVYFVSKLKEYIQNPDSKYYDWSAMELAAYKDKYLEIIIDAYKKEKRKEKKVTLLTAIAMTGTDGARFAYNELMNDATLSESILYREIARNGDNDVVNELLKKASEVPKSHLLGLLEGLRDSKKYINCDMLQKIFDKKNEKEIRTDILWTWVWTCPDSYVNFVKLNKNTFDDDMLSDAIDGVEDIIENVKKELKKEVLAVLNEIYDIKQNNKLREKIAEMLIKYATKNDLPFIDRIYKDCIINDEHEIEKKLLILKENLNKSK